ncbi:uncharacterized protein EV420DRAFT_703632 [Desarmillaria tabescens]|uniref:Uncharacterized protein n=1 Tax=Armillaria tabescens TaxID=1929756 RepID=A0AA39JZY4_ARMTA|nr:uncharacterized protein EV420DRAFT_703632 [Desarmillaria tabescens]KAK0452032.1 hypothetical protein EV420DRAFT_703632 [Desarmillaria tabescens]
MERKRQRRRLSKSLSLGPTEANIFLLSSFSLLFCLNLQSASLPQSANHRYYIVLCSRMFLLFSVLCSNNVDRSLLYTCQYHVQ